MVQYPKTSIIVPIYKVENYLCECIESIISQSYNNIEIILVDDGSPDKCPEICDEYAQKDNRIKVIHKQNGGLSDARNVGIENATGDYLSFVDSDDAIHHQMIESLMKPLVENPNLMISACQYLEFDNDFPIENNPDHIQTITIDFNDYFTKNFWMVAWGKIYHKHLFEGIQYPVGRYHEDEFTTYKMCYFSKNIAFTEEKLYYYRQRSGSITSTSNIKRIIDIHDAIKERMDFFELHSENKQYINALMIFAGYYCRFYNEKIRDERLSCFLYMWKKEISNISTQGLLAKQKIKFYLYVYMPEIKKYFSLIKCIMDRF